MGSFLKRHIFFYIILWFTTTLLFSQEAEDDVISVNAEKIEQTIDDAVEQKRTITNEDIRKSGEKPAGDA